jgi:SAM-dependent methyltransferase
MPRDPVEDDDALAGKASFDDIYTRDDPRAYYAALRPLDYQIPHHAQRLVRRILDARRRSETVVDLCCSYGVNAALLAHDVTLDDLYLHYAAESSAEPSDVLAHDRAYFAARRRGDAPRMIGLDLSAPAIAYARSAGLLDAGFAENLEAGEPSAAFRAAVSTATLVTVSGGVGYIGHRTFARVVGAVAEPPWVVALVLREVSYEPIATALADFGLVTERLAGRTFRQRRFTDDAEAEAALKRIEVLGLSAAGLEDTGWYHAELYVSRPAADADVPLTELLDDDP